MTASRPASRFFLAAMLLFVAACGDCGGGTQRVRPQLVPPVELKDFGAVPVLNEKLETIEVLNVGRATLDVLGARIKEENSPFAVKSVPDAVDPGSSQNLEIAFHPPKEADYEATLVLETEDEDNPMVEVRLVGKGSTRALMEVEPASVDFGRVAECGSAVKTLTIRSKGTADLVINSIKLTDDTSPLFTRVGSWNTPVVVKAVAPNGLPGQIQLTVKYTVPKGTADPANGAIVIEGTDPDNRTVTVPITGRPNRAPVPAIAPLGNGSPGMTVTLDGSGSADPDGDAPLSYRWTLRKPLGSNTQIAAPDQPTTSMRLDPTVPGEYEVELNVTDGTGVKSCEGAKAKIVAAPQQKLLVEMFWNHAKTDVDLHFLRTRTSVVSVPPDDCHYANPRPDWGTPGDASDDPELLRDALTGYGPEVLAYVNPIDTTYRVVVELAHDHLDPNPASEVTVRIYQFGVVKAEFKKTLTRRGEIWSVADIEWPSGVITRIQ